MKAMILAAGLGSRLKEITQHTPKALVKAGNKTMLEHVLERLKAVGVSSLIINLHHLGNQIEQFVKDNNYFGIDIEFSYEQKLLGTGGGLKHASNFFKDCEHFFLYNCDVYCDCDLNTMLNFHKTHSPLATIAVMKRDTTRYLLFDREQNLIGWENTHSKDKRVIKESTHEEQLAFSGIHIISPEVFNYMDEQDDDFSIITPYLKAAQAGKTIKAFSINDAYWIDIGSQDKLELLKQRLRSDNLCSS